MFKLQAIGLLGNDATSKEINNKVVINFDVAYSKKVKEAYETTWVRCAYWREIGKTGLLPYLKKGTKVLVEGEPKASHYVDKNGNTVATLEIFVSNIELLSASSDGSRNDNVPASQPTQSNNEPDDLPF